MKAGLLVLPRHRVYQGSAYTPIGLVQGPRPQGAGAPSTRVQPFCLAKLDRVPLELQG